MNKGRLKIRPDNLVNTAGHPLYNYVPKSNIFLSHVSIYRYKFAASAIPNIQFQQDVPQDVLDKRVFLGQI